MNSVKCAVCKASCKKFVRKENVTYFKCPACHSMFMSPMPTVDAMKEYANMQYSNGVYSEYVKAKSLKVETFELRMKDVHNLLKKSTPGPIKHLDVGCSAGFMIEVGLSLGFDSSGVEFSNEAIALAAPEIQKRIKNIDVNILGQRENARYDLITCYDIVEHVQDPYEFLLSLKRLLNPDGLLVITTPDSEHTLATIMGSHWPMLQPMQHTILFSKRGLRLILEKVGLKEELSTVAYKVVTLDYLCGQIKALNPVISKLMTIASKTCSTKFYQKPRKFNISEFMSVSRAT